MSELGHENLSFGQRAGAEALPNQLKLKEISQQLRSLLWAITHDSIGRCTESGMGYYNVGQPWRTLLRSYFILRKHGDLDNFSHDVRWSLNFAKGEIYSQNYLSVLNFVDFVIASDQCPSDFYNGVSSALEYTHAAYRVCEKQIIPVGSDENALAITQALRETDTHPAKGPSKHLRLAAQELTDGNWASSIRESIHAVEASAKVLEPNADTLGPALSKLEAGGIINAAQKKAFGALYGYASDTEGIRHALAFDDKAKVMEKDAMFMFGACAAFVSYLLSN